MTEQKLKELGAKAVEDLQAGTRGQQTLRKNLGLDEKSFEELKEYLIAQDKVILYRARGGGIRLKTSEAAIPKIDDKAISEAKTVEETEIQKLLTPTKTEESLYPYVNNWALNSTKYGFSDSAIIGNKHRRKSWDNPDLIAWQVYEFENFVGHEIELTTFEVKLSFSVYAIWQACNYRRFSHQTILACYERPDIMYAKEDGRLLEISQHFGIGLISLTPAGAGGKGVTCTEILSPVFQAPPRYELDSFLSDFHDFLKLPHPGSIISNQTHVATISK